MRESVLQSEQPPAENLETSSAFRLLWMSAEEPSWDGLTWQLEQNGSLQPEFCWVREQAEILALLRKQTVSCLVIQTRLSDECSRELLNVVALLNALCTTGTPPGLVVLADQVSDRAWKLLAEYPCEILVSSSGSDSAALMPMIKRALKNTVIRSEHHRHVETHRQRLVRERDETERVLLQQQNILEQVQGLMQSEPVTPKPASDSTEGISLELETEISAYYQQFLRTFVMMAEGQFRQEISQLAGILAHGNACSQDVVRLHLQEVGKLVYGLGEKSARHLMNRADLLILELIMQLANCYQQRSEL